MEQGTPGQKMVTEQVEGQRWQVQSYIYCESPVFVAGLHVMCLVSLSVACNGLTASSNF